ncbi:MAG: hypothetical protein AAGJ83_15485, partial [Planctomycetota bacterium]
MENASLHTYVGKPSVRASSAGSSSDAARGTGSCRLFLAMLVVCLPAWLQADEIWNQFRGPDGSGISSNSRVSLVVDPQTDSVWRTEIPGLGWSSPVTDGERIWLTAARVTEATEAERAERLANVTLAQMKDVAGSVDMIAICLNANSGKILQTVELGPVAEPKPIHPMNGYASPTPVIAGDRVGVDFGQYGTWCLDNVTG